MKYEQDLISTHLRRLWSRYSQRIFFIILQELPPGNKTVSWDIKPEIVG